MVIIADEMVDR